ncbi:MAG: hypothetical protein COT74_04385 [Bdellovibrionales bacterium CG10_big_fil_rev_8_21_14_0_10_45_34]|nr:MAG: hypothetical protein COT74_04385 [Bdellovibrionales bacterium CG10_big_fil_rev_8_21_14_0_10_45_34]
MSSKVEIVIGLCTLSGDFKKGFSKALELCRNFINTEELSQVYRYGRIGLGGPYQREIISMALRGTTMLDPDEIAQQLLSWNASGGQAVILLYSDLVQLRPDLPIPNPLLVEEDYYLETAREVARNWVHPILNKTLEVIWRERAPEFKGEFLYQGKSLLSEFEIT